VACTIGEHRGKNVPLSTVAFSAMASEAAASVEPAVTAALDTGASSAMASEAAASAAPAASAAASFKFLCA
jgi:hypothetical protein